MLVVEEEALLNALVKSLCTAKFRCPPEDVAEIAGSPLVAEVLNRAYDALVCAYRLNHKEGYAGRLEQQRDVRGQDWIVETVYAHVRLARAYWRDSTAEQRQELVLILISPYSATPDVAEAIVGRVDSLVNAES